MDPRGRVGRIYSRIYKADHYTLLHTKYESFGPCGFEDVNVLPMTPPRARPVWTPGQGLVVSGKNFVLSFSHDAPRAGPVWTPRGTVGRIYKEDHYTLLQTKYESSGSCGFEEEDFLMFYP